MHWVLDEGDNGAVSALRSEVSAYLARHCNHGSDLDAATLVVSELATNALRHAQGPVWVSIDWSASQPELQVADVGPGFDLIIGLPPTDTPNGRGLYIANELAPKLAAHRRRAGGSIVTAVLPVNRATSVSIDLPRRRTAALPALSEASPTGGFPREPFLRALVVQLAHTVTEQHGPVAAEQAVAQVAADIGGQMEAEYRQALGIVGRLTPRQIAECLVRLKSAIGGGFSIAEADDRRIVLVNTHCPFGDAVKQAPALCRMTSSVFGGIAARNSDSSADVALEERIAIGDDGCRVVIDLDPPTLQAERWVHRYHKATETPPS